MGTVPLRSVLAPPPLGVKLKNPVLQIGLLMLPRSCREMDGSVHRFWPLGFSAHR